MRTFYGDLQSSPRVLLCATDACYRALGGGSRGVTLLDQALILSPREADTVIAAHELCQPLAQPGLRRPRTLACVPRLHARSAAG